MGSKNKFAFPFIGFSLIEVLIVLAILAVLASLAIPQYRKFTWKGKMAEVRTILPSISYLEEIRSTEKNSFITCGWYPGSAGSKKQEWSDDNCFSRDLNFDVKGGTFCDYAVVEGDFSTNPQNASVVSEKEFEPTSGVDITILARCDIDGDGKYAYFTLTDETSEIRGPFGDDF